MSSDNYAEAVNLLKSRFGNKQALISAHVEKLLNLPAANSSDDVSKLREVYDCIDVNVRSLKSLDVMTTQYGQVLVQIIMTKFPSDVKMIVSRQMAALTATSENGSEAWNIDDMLKLVKQEIESREMCFLVANDSRIESNERRRSSKFSGASLVASARSATCIYCGESHPSWKCGVVTDVTSRKNIIRRKGRCYICLQSGHISRKCESKYKCVKCKGRHNVSICEPPRENRGDKPPEKYQPPEQVKSIALNARNYVASVVRNRESATLLQTAQAILTDVDKVSKRTVRVLFDIGSQKSFVTEDVCKSLNLRVSRKEKLILSGFGSKNETVQLGSLSIDPISPSDREAIRKHNRNVSIIQDAPQGKTLPYRVFTKLLIRSSIFISLT